MNKLKSGLVAVVIILLIIPVKAQFRLSGEFRPRTEFSHGYKSLATENQNWSVATAQRTRLNAIFSANGINTKLVLQDVRYWGSQPQLVANEDYATSVHEGWAEVFLNKNLSFKAGRQELVYDDSRIFGNVGWAHQARSHDLVLFKLEKDFRLHIGIAHHENSDITNSVYNGPDAYKNLQFGWFNTTWNKNSLSLLILNNGVPVWEGPEEVTKYSQTIGGRLTASLELIGLAANLYYQTGNHISGKKISALNFLTEISADPFLVGYEYLSGNSYNKDDKVYAFTPFYGTNHKFNGFMDYFYVGNHINSVGLQDAYLRYSISKNKFGANATLHYFQSAGKINEDSGRYLGTELDLSVSWQVQNAASFSAGWSTMFAGKNLELLKGGDHTSGNHWAYLMLSVTPQFIK